jgi:integrase
MMKGKVPALHLDPTTRRALQRDALATIPTMDRRDRLAELLTDDCVETLKHLAREGMGENSLRALASDLAYLEAWADAAAGQSLPWPATEALALKFVAHHLWDPSKRVSDPDMGCPTDFDESLRAEGLLRCEGPYARNTVKRRLASGSTLHRWKRIEGPFAAPSLRSAVRAWSGPRERKSKRAVTRDVLDRLIAACATDRLTDTRDLAILLLAFSSGGRRRSEVARLRVEQLRDEPPPRLDSRDPQSPPPPCLAIQLGGPRRATLTRRAGRFWSAGRGAARMAGAGRHQEGVAGGGGGKGLTPQSINLIVKRRCAMAGLEPEAFSAQGLRAGYLTEAARQGVSLPEAMQQSQHRSVQQAASYYNEAERVQGRAQSWGFDRALLKVAGRQLPRFCIPPGPGLGPELTSRPRHSARSERLGSRKLPAGNFS